MAARVQSPLRSMAQICKGRSALNRRPQHMQMYGSKKYDAMSRGRVCWSYPEVFVALLPKTCTCRHHSVCSSNCQSRLA